MAIFRSPSLVFIILTTETEFKHGWSAVEGGQGAGAGVGGAREGLGARLPVQSKPSLSINTVFYLLHRKA